MKIWLGTVIMVMYSTLIMATSSVQVSSIIAPLSYLVSDIAGDTVQSSTIVPPGASPHVFEPSPRMVKELRRADLIVTIASMELSVAHPHRLAEISPKSRLLDLARGEVLLEGHDHHHGDDHSHDHEEELGDPHIWMSPLIMARQTLRIADHLGKLNPSQASIYQKRASTIAAQLVAKTATYRKKFATRDIAVVVVHPSLSYMAKDIGFTQMAIEENGRPPTVRQLRKLIAAVRKHPHCVIVVQPQYGQDLVDLLAARTGAPVIRLDIYQVRYPDQLFKVLDQIWEATSPTPKSR